MSVRCVHCKEERNGTTDHTQLDCPVYIVPVYIYRSTMVTFPMPKLIFVAVLSGLILVSEQCQDSCPEDWKVFNDRCFKFFGQHKTWFEAQTYCETQGGSLPSVHSIEEEQFVKELVKASDPQESPFWIGLTDRQQEGVWTWSDGSTVDFQYWNDGEPNNLGDEDCTHSNWGAQKRWNDIPCDLQYVFICQAVKQ